MTRRQLALPLIALALAAAGLGLWQLSASQEPALPSGPHALRGLPEGAERARVLAAVDAADAAGDPAQLAERGRELFNDRAIARQGESCASCHTAGGGVNAELGTTLHPQSDGDFTGARDATSLWGVGETAPYGWAGQLDSLDEFVVTTIHAHFVAGRAQPAERTAEQTAALVAYLRTLKPPITRFDQGPLSPAARRGEDLFQGKGGCIGCHTGPLLTDNALHNTLVPKVSPSDTDVGASGQAGSPLFGAFNTPHLRDLRNTAPYMHNGVFKTLEEVVEFYNSPRSSTGPLRLTPQETADLVAYLASL